MVKVFRYAVVAAILGVGCPPLASAQTVVGGNDNNPGTGQVIIQTVGTPRAVFSVAGKIDFTGATSMTLPATVGLTGTFNPDKVCLDSTNKDACITRVGATSLAVGTSTPGNASGTLNAATYIAGTSFTGPGTVAGTGDIRLQNGITHGIVWRNAGNTQDIGIGVDASNVVRYDSGTVFPSGIFLYTASANGLQITSSGNANIIGSVGGSLQFSGIPAFFNNGFPPLISSGFGTSPSVASNNGTVTFRVNVGGGGVATSGVVNMNNTATTGFNCQVTDMTTNIVTRETASSTTTVTVTAASAWTANDILIFNCAAY